jgi:hypothetical protein
VELGLKQAAGITQRSLYCVFNEADLMPAHVVLEKRERQAECAFYEHKIRTR